MKAADLAQQRRRDARLLVVDGAGRIAHRARSELADLLMPGDLVVANDAATLPASLAGTHVASGAAIEVRLAGRRSLEDGDATSFIAVVFGSGDFRMRTEDRPPPPTLHAGNTLALGPLVATVVRLIDHPRLVEIRFADDADVVRAGLARHGRPVQYAHLATPLDVWDTWTRIAADPVAFEAPSAGFVLDWRLLDRLVDRGIGFTSLTHAAGLSSTGDAVLDARLPFDEIYRLPASTVAAIVAARECGERIVALGTTVARALEHAAARTGGLRAGPGLATNRLGASTRLQVVDVLISGTHAPGSSHHELLRAFTDDSTLDRIDAALESSGYRTHEYGDSVLIERAAQSRSRSNLKTATLASRLGNERTTLPA
jgi:S-adenosylmethionine:tRNA ribosyltransferase-isomerase